jgi:hypothetical protein
LNIKCNLLAKGRSISYLDLIVGVTDEAQSACIRSSTVREILHIRRKLVERTFHLVNVVLPSFEQLSIGDPRLSSGLPLLVVDILARRLWKLVLEPNRYECGFHDLPADFATLLSTSHLSQHIYLHTVKCWLRPDVALAPEPSPTTDIQGTTPEIEHNRDAGN